MTRLEKVNARFVLVLYMGAMALAFVALGFVQPLIPIGAAGMVAVSIVIDRVSKVASRRKSAAKAKAASSTG